MTAPAHAHDLAPTLADLLAEQAGLVARGQVGVAEAAVLRREIAVRRWQRCGPRVVAAHNGPLSQEQHLWAAVLHHWPHGVLAGMCAARLGGLTGFDVPLVDVLVPWERRGPSLQGVRCRATRHFDVSAVHPVASPPRMRMAPTLVQAAAWSPAPRRAAAILAAGVQQRLVRPAELRAALLRTPAVRHRGLLVAVIGDLEGGSHALGELDALRLCRAAGLPEPTRQSVRRDRHGRRRYLDLDWEPWGLSGEIDGLQHGEVRIWCDDLLRQNEEVIVRRAVLRFPSLVVRAQPTVFVDQVRRALLARGWRP